MMRTFYISGPMTGIPDFNFPAFLQAEETLRRILPGVIVLNPAKDVNGETHHPREDYLRIDVRMVTESTDVLLLPGDEYSRGAALERLVAREIGVRLWRLSKDDLFETLVPWDLPDASCTAWEAVTRILSRGVTKHDPGGWRREGPGWHLRRVARHAVTALDLVGSSRTHDGEPALDHAERALTRAALALAGGGL